MRTDKQRKQPWRIFIYMIRNRCSTKNQKYYKKGIKCNISMEEVKTLWYRDKAYKLKRPSIDRIDNDGDYTFKNCRFIELSENSRLGGYLSAGKSRKGRPPICIIKDCNNKHYALNLCNNHYLKKRRKAIKELNKEDK